MNSRGQMFESYRLLIGAIIALVILMMIISGINYVMDIKYRVSYERFFIGVENAAKTPNRTVVLVDNLSFAEGTIISKKAISKRFTLSEDCIEFQKPDHYGSIADVDGGYEFKTPLVIDIYMQCKIDNSCDRAPIRCLVSFIKKIED